MKILIIFAIVAILWLSIIILTVIETKTKNKVLKILLKLFMLFLIFIATILIWITLFYGEIYFK